LILTANDLPSNLQTPEEVRLALGTIRTSFASMRQQIGEVIVGQQRVIDLVLVAILADGHVLLEGPPGLGKTLLVRTLGDVLALSNSRIQCTADLGELRWIVHHIESTASSSCNTLHHLHVHCRAMPTNHNCRNSHTFITK